MVAVRRVYVLLVCSISLQSVTWAVITLLRDLVASSIRPSISTTALQIAVILVGLPVFLIHWLWAQKLTENNEERGALLRRVYLYATLAAYLAPFVANTFDLITNGLRLAIHIKTTPLPTPPSLIADLITMLALGILWSYHNWILRHDTRIVPDTANLGIIRRLYVFVFSGTGFTLTTIGVIQLLRWVMLQSIAPESITNALAQVAVGLPLWIGYWLWAQNLFNAPTEEERESILRKVYLYLVVFIAVLTAVTSAAILFAGVLRAALGLPSQGDLRDPLSLLVAMIVAWAYHAFILARDTARVPELPRQENIRRLYNYLVAAIGLAAFLIGLGGDVSVVIRSLSELSVTVQRKEELAWFTAALCAGLIVWLLPWRRSQNRALASGETGAAERRSIIRKIFLYFYLFVATMTILASMIYILFRFLSILLGDRFLGNLISDIAQAFAYALIAAGVWIYHGLAVRRDNQFFRREQSERLAAWRVALIDAGDGNFGRRMLDELRRALPGLALDAIGLTPAAVATLGANQDNVADRVKGAQIIIAPSSALGATAPEAQPITNAISASAARKLVVPLASAGWEWIGVEEQSADALAQQTARAIKQAIAGESIAPSRSLQYWVIVGIVVIILLCVVPQLISTLMMLMVSTR